jgi:hypothetical protein
MKTELVMLRRDLVVLSKMPPPQAAKWLRDEQQTGTLLALIDICLRELETLRESNEREFVQMLGSYTAGFTQQLHYWPTPSRRVAMALAGWVRGLPLLPHWVVGFVEHGRHCVTGAEGEVVVYHLAGVKPAQPVKHIGMPRGGPPVGTGAV